MTPSLKVMVINHATRHDLDPLLVAAICQVESELNPWAVRPEPNYKWLYHVDRLATLLNVPKKTEEDSQKHSYGLMQVMGAVARELGFKGRYLTELCDPNQALVYGCLHLKHKLDRYQNWPAAVAAYNAGHAKWMDKTKSFANQVYVDKIHFAMKSLEGLGWD